MPDRPFAHLHCHTHYSLLDGASRIPELVALVKKLGMNAVAMTDHGNLYGAIEFYRECKAAGLNPVIGYEAYVAPASRTEREAKRRGDAGYHLTLLDEVLRVALWFHLPYRDILDSLALTGRKSTVYSEVVTLRV
jgi:DNA polymerase-3 subunit alpha